MFLGIDTATSSASIALDDGVCIHSEYSWRSNDNHTVELAKYVDRMITSASVNIKSLKAIAVTIGPGSFTGIRIGLGFAKGLALSYSLPLIGVSTMDVLAHMQPEFDGSLLTIIQAGRQRLVVGKYTWKIDDWSSFQDPYITSWQDILKETETGDYYICGELSSKYSQKFDDNVIIASSALNVRRAAALIDIARNRINKGEVDHIGSLSPHYVRSATDNAS